MGGGGGGGGGERGIFELQDFFFVSNSLYDFLGHSINISEG